MNSRCFHLRFWRLFFFSNIWLRHLWKTHVCKKSSAQNLVNGEGADQFMRYIGVENQEGLIQSKCRRRMAFDICYDHFIECQFDDWKWWYWNNCIVRFFETSKQKDIDVTTRHTYTYIFILTQQKKEYRFYFWICIQDWMLRPIWIANRVSG